MVMKPAVIVTGGRQGIGLAVCRRLIPDWEIIPCRRSGQLGRCRRAGEGVRWRPCGRVPCGHRPRRCGTGSLRTTRRGFSARHRGVWPTVQGSILRRRRGSGSDDEELKIFRVNVLGAQHMVNLAVPLMAKLGSGSIVDRLLHGRPDGSGRRRRGVYRVEIRSHRAQQAMGESLRSAWDTVECCRAWPGEYRDDPRLGPRRAQGFYRGELRSVESPSPRDVANAVCFPAWQR